jgi:cell division septation protein DedD
LPTIATSTPVLAKPLLTDSAHFYVNVGLFANTSNANNAHARVAVAGLPVVSQTVNTSKGTLTRVRAGPFDSSSDAKEAIKRIEALGLDAKLVQ